MNHMSLYQHGLALSSGAVVVPESARMVFDRFGRLTSGLGMVKRGQPSKWYHRGVHNTVGAVTPGPLGTLMDTFIGLVMDVAHVMLIIGGLFLLRQSLTF